MNSYTFNTFSLKSILTNVFVYKFTFLKGLNMSQFWGLPLNKSSTKVDQSIKLSGLKINSQNYIKQNIFVK